MRNEQKKYYIATFGCQMNVHDSEKMAGILNSNDYKEVSSAQDADVVIFNTCSIREKAEHKFFSELGRIKMLKKKKPGLKIAVAGCIAQQHGKKLLKRASFVDCVIGPQNIHQIFDTLQHADRSAVTSGGNETIAETEMPVFRKTDISALVNIMYGCNNFCSYCIVPHTRGREQSRASQSIINEIRSLAEKGYKEVTLLGQNVNSYASDLDFPELLAKINEIEGILRIRFVTSNPKDLSEKLIEVMRDSEKICEHLHLPLQSGSTKILSMMNRKYSYEKYFQKVELLRKMIPDIAITTDIIAGFPQETDDDHALTMNSLRELSFDGIYAFKFSPRKGTSAALMDGQVDQTVRAERLQEILDIQNDITELKNKKLEGTTQEILIDGIDEKDSGLYTGRTRTNKIITVPKNDNIRKGLLLNVLINQANRHSLNTIL
ncbi:MAG: tRNA (N6-isopentenyl adenosine(37)-C2)-methylthiotransferase MiaB [Nitrospirae bacterium]|nr:tRNA (N6-isopentenyl adenosine(37)-C2)-methylthiotransferase MiaB [Nitrospirota bacterium]